MKTIVVGVDGSGFSQDALRWAVDEGRRRQWPVEAVLAWTFPYAVPGLGNLSDPRRMQRHIEEQLAALLHVTLGEGFDAEVASRVEEGPAARVLLEAAGDAGLLVVGSRGRGGFAGLVLGSVSQQCAQHARCPVAVVRPEEVGTEAGTKEGPTARIVVGVDGSDAAQAALRWAIEEARLRQAAVSVVHAWQLPHLEAYPFPTPDIQPGEVERNAREILAASVGGVDTRGIREVDPILACDGAAAALLDTSKGADLLVVGSRGRGGFAGLLLGSVSQKVLHHAVCPIVVVPAG